MKCDKQTVLSTLGENYASGLQFAELAAAFGLTKNKQHRLRRVLSQLVSEGAVDRIGRGQYALARQREDKKTSAKRRRPKAAGSEPQAVGRIRVHPAGYGFVEREDGFPDVFVPAKYRGASLDGDRVLLYTWDGYKGTEGRVEEVLARGRAKITGVVGRAGRGYYLEPDDPRIATDYGRILVAEGVSAASVDQCALVEITRYPTELRPSMEGRLLRLLGPPEDPNTEIEKIIAVDDIPVEFPPPVMAQAKATPQSLGSADTADRIDLRDRPFLTIDPETARDFDDALCVEALPNRRLRVWVAVADVSHYVMPDDPMDMEAQIRGVSVYLPDRVIPMLPFELSSGICSLNPDEDRCAMVVRLDYSERGELLDTSFAAAVIRSHARLDYPGVAAALAGDFRGQRARYRKWSPALAQLSQLAQRLRTVRRTRGTLEMDIPEPKVVLDADDPLLVRDVVRAKGVQGVKAAYELVEEFMIAANEAVGAFFARRGFDTVWRIHPPPAEDRVAELGEVLKSFGIKVDSEAATTPLGMRRVLEAIGDRPAARALSFLLLRSLSQAAYATENVGHFGLASTEYLHFTSPIRRYPDVLVHRLLKAYLHLEGQASGGGAKLRIPPADELQALAAESSSHERRAIEAEREVVAMYRAYLMRDNIGDVFSGMISAVTSFGVFVEINAPFVEGLIKLDSLGDEYWEFDSLRAQIRGRTTGRILTLGDEVEVEVTGASVTRRRIELRLVSHKGSLSSRPEPKPKSRTRPRTRAKPPPKRKLKASRKGPKSTKTARPKPKPKPKPKKTKTKAKAKAKPRTRPKSPKGRR